MHPDEWLPAGILVAAVVCVSSAVAGEMLQDLKVRHILGGTPRSMQIGCIFGIIVANLVLYFPLVVLHVGNIRAGGDGFRRPRARGPAGGPDGHAVARHCGR